jgi:hypothetical protein
VARFQAVVTAANNFDVKPNTTSIISYAEMPKSINQIMTGVQKEFYFGT